MIYIIFSLLIAFTPVKDKDSSLHKKNNKNAPPGTVWIRDKFYMDKTEITNESYREYLYWLNKHHGSESEEYKIALPDTLVWRDSLAYNEPYVDVYFRHPAYAKYPVVGISYEQAVNYCEWRSDRVNEFIYIDKNKVKWTPDMKFESPVPNYVKYRLPTKEEWEYAARGGLKEADYPWGGYYLTNYKGEKMAAYNSVGDENIFYNDSLKILLVTPDGLKPVNLNGYAETPVTVGSYPPNEYGIYEICGNVAEMIAERGITKGGSHVLPGYHLRITFDSKYTKPTNDIGFRCACEKLIDY